MPIHCDISDISMLVHCDLCDVDSYELYQILLAIIYIIQRKAAQLNETTC